MTAPPTAGSPLETALKSIVLLKNEAGTLPLKRTLKTIAVIGPDADDAKTLLGNYNGIPAAPVTILEGIRAAVPRTRVLYARGGGVAHPTCLISEVIPSTSLFTSNDASRRTWTQRRIFQLRQFRRQAAPSGGADVSQLREVDRNNSAQPVARLHSRGCQRGFQVGRWRAPCRHE